mmetsp:Transcript_2808/g.8699  ORF Transcript_2808/g.8699 Transcript_2808/m.8699 type:complete len:265 (+) Transcript_2808:226-1020(+)
MLVLDVLLQELLDDVLERDNPGHVHVRRDHAVALPGLCDILWRAGDQREVAPALLELVQQVQHGNTRRDDHQGVEAQGLHASALAALVLRGHHDELLHQDKAPQVVLVHRVHGNPGVAAVEDLLQQRLRQALAPLQHPGVLERHHRVLRRHVGEEHHAVHDLQLVPLLNGEVPGLEIPGEKLDHVLRVSAFSFVELEGVIAVAALERGAGLHVVDGAITPEPVGLPDECDDGVVIEIVLRLRCDDAQPLIIVAFEGDWRRFSSV